MNSRVRTGHIVLLRLYEVAYEIDTSLAADLLTRRTTGSVERVRLARTTPRAVHFEVPPIGIDLGPADLPGAGTAHRLSARARIYDFGVISVALRMPVEDVGWADYCALANDLAAAADSPEGLALWADLRRRAIEPIEDALVRPIDTALEEDYLLAIVKAFSSPLEATSLRDDPDLVTILSGESRELSGDARAQLLRQVFSYYPDDLVALTWDRCLIVEPEGDADTAEVIEMANAQLLEMRYYNEILEDELPRMYDRVEETRRTLHRLSRRGYSGLARDLHTLVAEVTELKEKVENALEVTRDIHLARIYGGALEAFRVPLISASVDRKLAIIRDTYTALYNDALHSRTEILEATIVLLILVDIILALLLGR